MAYGTQTKKSESKIQHDIINRYEKDGWYVVKLIKTNKNGIPDLACFKNGTTIFIEVKRPGEKPRPLQEFRHEELRKKGFEVLVLSE